MKGISYMEHLLAQVQELLRQTDILITECNKAKARVHDLEIDNARLVALNDLRVRQYDELHLAYKAMAAHVESLEKRGKANRERIRQMESGEL